MFIEYLRIFITYLILINGSKCIKLFFQLHTQHAMQCIYFTEVPFIAKYYLTKSDNGQSPAYFTYLHNPLIALMLQPATDIEETMQNDFDGKVMNNNKYR